MSHWLEMHTLWPNPRPAWIRELGNLMEKYQIREFILCPTENSMFPSIVL